MAVIRVLQFADIINRYDFIDNIVRCADPNRFLTGVCVRTSHSNIASPAYGPSVPRWVLSGPSRREMPRAVFQVSNILQKWKADILHTHHYDQAIIGLLATRLHSRTRLIVGRHYSDAIYRSTTGVKRSTLIGLEQLVNRAAAKIIAPSAFVREILTKWQGIDSSKIEQIPYGFVSEKYKSLEPRDVANIKDDLGLQGRFVLGNFGRLHEEKGQRFLLQAMAELRTRMPNLLLLIVGEGPERPFLTQQIQNLGLVENVLLLGWRQDVPALMASVDVVVQPSLQEAFSQVMAEALWMRKPLIMTDVSGAPDVIRNGENGLLVPRGDSSALSAAIFHLFSDFPFASRLGESGRKFVENNLTVEKVIPLYEACYLRTMKLPVGSKAASDE